MLSAFAASDDVAPDGGLGGFLQQLVVASSHDLGERCVWESQVLGAGDVVYMLVMGGS